MNSMLLSPLSAQPTRNLIALLFLTIKHLVRMDISARVLSGPIEIARASGESLRMGPAAFIHLLAFVSIQLGVINLFPIPGLDGGHTDMPSAMGIPPPGPYSSTPSGAAPVQSPSTSTSPLELMNAV